MRRDERAHEDDDQTHCREGVLVEGEEAKSAEGGGDGAGVGVGAEAKLGEEWEEGGHGAQETEAWEAELDDVGGGAAGTVMG